MLDWDKMSEDYSPKYKDYAPDGVYKVKLGTVETHESSTGTVWMDFKPDDDDKYAYPKFSHPVSSKNANWRAWHFKELFVLLGASEDGAKKNVESCESKSDFAHVQAAYLSAMERLVAKKPEVEIEVWKDGKYSRADFNTPVRLNRPEEVKETASDDMFGEAEDASETISADEIPF